MQRSRTLAALAALLIATGAWFTSAQAGDDPADTSAPHPVVGAWVVDDNIDDPANPPTVFIFEGDGTFVRQDPLASNGNDGGGVWEATGDRAIAATVKFPIGNNEIGYQGLVTVRVEATVSDDGSTLDVAYTAEFTTPDGQPTGQGPLMRAAGERIVIEPIAAALAATPVATPAA